jgi:bifunctional DNA-binding transcriptional regulator/antitoxin component of YhaV-PrlF toxin-antitoxin module
MKTTITKRGQTSVPAGIIKKYNLKKGSKLYWLDTGKEIKVIPIPDNIVQSTFAVAEGEGLFNELIESRKRDRLNET